MEDFSRTILCSVTADQAYIAVTREMSNWWTPMSGPFEHAGDQAKTGFGGESYWLFKARTLNRPDLIELDCMESRMIEDTLDDPEEWLGTTLRFEISEVDGNAKIVFTHIGLNPAMQCYDVCEGGWDHYIPGSLRDYLHGEGGKPNTY